MERSQITRIKGLSERRRLPRLNKIRLGLKVINSQGKTYPREVNWFVCPPEVQAIYGEQPKELDIMFPIEDEEQVFPQAYKFYGSGQGLKCKGDGEVALRRWEDCTPQQQAEIGNGREPNDLVEVSCPCEKLGGECSASGNLMVLLPKVSCGGIYQIDTGSASNITTINSYIDYIRSITTTPRNPNGRIALIPLKLRRVEQKMQYVDKNGKTKSSTHYLLQMELKINIDDIEKLRRDSIAIIGARYQIEAPKEDGRDYPEVVIDEEEIEKQPQNAPILNELQKPATKTLESSSEFIGKEAKGQSKPIIAYATPQLKALGERIHANYKTCGVLDEDYRLFLKQKFGVESSTQILSAETLKEIMTFFNPQTFSKIEFEAIILQEKEPIEDTFATQKEILVLVETDKDRWAYQVKAKLMNDYGDRVKAEMDLPNRLGVLSEDEAKEILGWLEGLIEGKLKENDIPF